MLKFITWIGNWSLVFPLTEIFNLQNTIIFPNPLSVIWREHCYVGMFYVEMFNKLRTFYKTDRNNETRGNVSTMVTHKIHKIKYIIP